MRFRNPLTVLSVAGAALLGLAALAPGAGLVPAAQAQDKEPIKIALVQGTSGSPLEVFSRQSQDGFKLGIEYATGGSNMVLDRPIEIITKDTQFKPDVARAVLATRVDLYCTRQNVEESARRGRRPIWARGL